MLKHLSIFIIVIGLTLSASCAFARGRDIVKIATDIDIPKDMIAGDVVAIGGNVTVSGRVENNVVAIVGSVTLSAGSSVGGQVVVVGGELIQHPAAGIGGRITQVYMPRFIPSFTDLLGGGWLAVWVTISILALLGFLGISILLAALIPDHVGAAVNALERSFIAMLMWGILWMILIVPIAVLLAISIVGIILIPLEIILVVLAMIIGYIASAIYIGKNILLSFKKVPPPFVDAILGILLLALIGFVPFVGPVIKALFLIAGFGAVLTTRFGTIK
ncbi:MAG: hypothetical protein Q8N91_05185 [Candidatus Omnitrophota bacterium]|nr:hypothetical protein [Candidatus Omnitrophota bacterium]